MNGPTYLLNRIQSRICRLNGISHSSNLPEKSELRQSFADHVVYTSDQLPPKVDLRPNLTTVEDQSQIGSCVANTLAGAYEYLIKKGNGSELDVSRLFIYYNARREGEPNAPLTDSGCSMTSAIQCLEKYGVCPESDWPYDINRVHEQPSDDAYGIAQQYQIKEALRINIDLNEMKACLAQGFPFAFGLTLFNSFDKAAKSGIVPMPDQYEQGRQSHGSHAMLAVGYSDHSSSFIVRNSWGKYWGDQGYCYIPYEYMTNPELCFDAWTVRQFSNDDFGQDHWDNDDSVDYYHHDDPPADDETEEESGHIEHYHDEQEMQNDWKQFAGNLLNGFISLAF